MLDNNKIVSALQTVIDPNSGKDIVTQRRVSDLRIEGKNVFFSLSLTGINSEQKSALNFASIAAINALYPEAEVHVHMKQEVPGAMDNSVLPQVKNIIAVASGKGGVGKSTVSVNLCFALQQKGYKAAILDADLYGPSIPTMLGIKDEKPKVKEVDGKHKIIPIEKDGVQVMSIGFVVEAEQAVVLRGPRLAGILKQFIQDCIWPDLDYLIIDLPPGTGDIQLTLVQTVPVTGAIIVTTPQDVAVADAVKAMNMFRLSNIDVPILGVVENMSWFSPAELPDNKYHLFGEGGGEKLAKMADTELLGQIPLVQSVGEQADHGVPAVLSDKPSGQEAFLAMADRVVAAVDRRNKEKDPTLVVPVVG